MKKMLPYSRIVFCLGLVFLLATPAGAAWTYVHGHSGHVEGYGGPVAKAYGIDFVPGSSNTFWVHYSVPCQQRLRLKKINVQFYAGIDSKVTQIDVYKDGTLKQSFTGLWDGTQNLVLSLSPSLVYNGALGISIKCESGPDGGVGQFTFYRVGANLIQ